MKKTLVMALMAGTALVLSGCGPITLFPGVTVQPFCSTVNYGPYHRTVCGPRIRVRQSTGPMGKGFEMTSVANFSQIKFDLTGSTVVFPLSGNFTVTMKNQVGIPIAVRNFSWNRNNNIITAINFQEIENWVNSVSSDIYVLDVNLLPVEVQTHAGANVASLTVNYNNAPVAMGAAIWTDCPTGSPPPGAFAPQASICG